MGKAIYQPKGKAREYNHWAVNFYNGCSGKCTYCYNRKGRSAKILGKEEPTLKKTLVNEDEAIRIFHAELKSNMKELQENGLFFNFVSDPFLSETIEMTREALIRCNWNDIPAIFLTKQIRFIAYKELMRSITWQPWHSVVGFSLTGHDELEPGCSPNSARIEAMKYLHGLNVKTWASIEPVIDFKSSLKMIDLTTHCCNHYKIGLESGKKYDEGELANFVEDVNNLISYENDRRGRKITVYWKDSIADALALGDIHLVFLTSQPFIVNANYKFWK